MRVNNSVTLNTQLVPDGTHPMVAISEAIPGQTHDKKLRAQLPPAERWPAGCEAKADKGAQGVADHVSHGRVTDPETGAAQPAPRRTGKTPVKNPPGQELTAEQHTFHRHLNHIRIRLEHGIGWVKHWAIMATRFRGAHTIYTALMGTVCGLVNAQTQRWQAAKAVYCA